MTSQSNSYPESSQAVTVFVLGLLGLVFGILAPFAWYMGNQEIKAIDAGRRDPKDKGLAQAGRVLGMVVTLLWVVGVALLILVLVLVVAVGRETSAAWGGVLPIL